jgi:glycosyltransferase involved in cell wall biosynthesis
VTPRVLWVKAGILTPPDTGGRLRSYHIVRRLAERYPVTYLGLVDADEPVADREATARLVGRCVLVERAPLRRGSLRFVADALVNLVASEAPQFAWAYRSAALRRAIAEEAARADVVVCDFATPWLSFPRPLLRPVLLFEHNVEADIWRRHAETATFRPLRAYFGVQFRRAVAYEREAVRSADHVVAVSEVDREAYVERYGADPARITVVPTGVDTRFYTPLPAAPEPATLVFLGSMDWLPNQDGVRWFLREVFPLVLAARPDARLLVVGRRPPQDLVEEARRRPDRIEVTGRVDDVRPWVARGAALVVPLRVGGGTRLKVFEALAMARPVVSTRVGAEGLPVEHGRHVLLADAPADFAAACLRLIHDPDGRARIGAEGRRLVVDGHDWAVVADRFAGVLESLAGGRAALPAAAGRELTELFA